MKGDLTISLQPTGEQYMRTALTFEGNPCQRGGHTERYKNSGACVECTLTYRDRPGVKEKDAARAKTPEAKERQRVRNLTPKSKATRARYHKSEKGKAIVRASQAIYLKTDKGKAARLTSDRNQNAKEKAARLAAKLIQQVDK
jgi:hypothetical protein